MEITQEKREILDRALATPNDANSQIIIRKAQDRGWLPTSYDKQVSSEKQAQPIKSSGSFADDIIQSSKTMAQKPGKAGIAVGRGLMRSWTDIVPQGLEKLEAATSFPVVRGAELAARSVVPKESRAPLTSFADLVQRQLEATKQLEAEVPGVERGSEIGAIIGQVGPAIVSGGSKLLAKGVSKVAASRAARQAAKTEKIIASLLAVPKGSPISQAIIKRPEAVRDILAQGALSTDDLAKAIRNELHATEAGLGKKVGEFRKATLADTKGSVDIPRDQLSSIVSELAEATQLKGQSLLPSSMTRNIDLLKRVVIESDKISPSDAMKAIDLVDGLIDYGRLGGEGSNILRQGDFALANIRGILKESVRAGNKEWAKADSAFSEFKTASSGLMRRIEGRGAESFINQLFGSGKTATRRDLQKALDLASEVDPSLLDRGSKFLDTLADLKAAQKIEGVRLGIEDPVADRVHRIVMRLTAVGAAAGAAVVPSAAVGGLVGGLGFRKIGMRMANPMRVLKSADKAKQLSSEAKELARELSYIGKNIGEPAINEMLTRIGMIPAVKELIQYSMNQASLADRVKGE